MSDVQRPLLAHLLRRAGFGASREDLARYDGRSYEDVVEELIHPDRVSDLDEDILSRYMPHTARAADATVEWNARWMYRMINSPRPLEEKMALFWHHVFATGWTKSEHTPTMIAQIQMFREFGLANLRKILVELSKDPAMIYWLDNCENHAGSINENYGRELLELFSMGIGNYTETDIKNVARAFTGWTFEQPLPLYPYGHYGSGFEYRPDDHDDGEKTFLGHSGNFNGDDIIEIIVKQEATARFISRHLYNFFVADEPQVPSWSIEQPGDPAAIDALVAAYQRTDADMRSVMRTLLNSDFFKAALYKRVKSPAEYVAGVLKLSGDFRLPEPGLEEAEATMSAMGQRLMDPPTVEGWHTGKEWIDGGTLTERVNYAVDVVNDEHKPGTRYIVDTIAASGGPVPAEQFVDSIEELSGYVGLSPETRAELVGLASRDGDLAFGSESERTRSESRIREMLTLIVATREYQFA